MRWLNILLASFLFLFSCSSPEPVREDEAPVVIKVDTVFFRDGKWICGNSLYQEIQTVKIFKSLPLWIGAAIVVMISSLTFFLLKRRYKKLVLEREAFECQAVLDLLKDRVSIVKTLVETHDKTVKRNSALSYIDQLESLQAIVDSYHQYLEELRYHNAFIDDIEVALNAGKGSIMLKTRKLLGDKVSEVDYKVLAMLYAGMTPSSVSFVTGISTGAIRTKKSRVKKRIEELPSSQEKIFVLELLK